MMERGGSEGRRSRKHTTRPTDTVARLCGMLFRRSLSCAAGSGGRLGLLGRIRIPRGRKGDPVRSRSYEWVQAQGSAGARYRRMTHWKLTRTCCEARAGGEVR